jgi:hypothetical protein
LIGNLQEFLRCSAALNYKAQQKVFNNQLTERLLEIADEHGYVFDEKEFTFTAVRDRIRSFYKSYVQSTKNLENTFSPRTITEQNRGGWFSTSERAEPKYIEH